MIVVPALLFSTAPGMAGGDGDDGETALASGSQPHVVAGGVALAADILPEPGWSAAIPAAAPAVPVPITAPPPPPPPPRPKATETGIATWYQITDGTCAHVTLPFGTVVTVTNLGNGVSTTCTVADRGPFGEGRVIDLDLETFAKLVDPSAGTAPVKLEWETAGPRRR